MITLGYWKTRGGGKVRVICVDAPGDQPVIAVGSTGGLYSQCADGRYHTDRSSGALDLIAPWTDPPKVRECWVAADKDGYPYYRETINDAKEIQAKFGGTIHHMREVNPAREKAVEKLVANVRGFLAGGTWSKEASAALAELEKSK